jgi:imidazolonepropionase-like amidohydrolase
VLCALAAPVGAERIAFIGARVMPVNEAPIDRGVLLINDGRIEAVGSADDIDIPRSVQRIELAESQVIIPGLVDTHSHVGEVSGGDRSGPIQPEARALDSVDIRSSGLKRALSGGITTVNIMPGSGHLVSGQTIYLKLRDGSRIADLAFIDEDGWWAGGMKFANGTNSQRSAPFPGTRAKSAAMLRQTLIKAQEYREQMQGDEPPARDLAMEALVEVLDGRRMVHFHSHRHDDLMTVARLKQEFGFRVVLHHTSEAYRVAEQLAEADIPVSLILVDSPGGKLEALNLLPKNAPSLEQAGVKTALHTDDWITDSRLFLRMAAMAVRAGMSRTAALEALTIRGAEMLDLDERVGTLEAGKDADFAILSGDPFSVYTRVQETWVEGQKRFDLDDEDDRLVAEGGYQALNSSDLAGHSHEGGTQ